MPEQASSGQVALLTPPGIGAIAVLRIAGAGIETFLGRHFVGRSDFGRRAYGRFVDAANHEIDDGLVLLYHDHAELHVHGSRAVVQRLLQLARAAGLAAMPAEAGFVVDDVLTGELLAALPKAATRLALATLLAQPVAWRRAPLDRLSPRDAARILADRSLHWLLSPPVIAIVGEPNVGKSTLANRLFGQQRSIVADVPGTTRDWVGETVDIEGLAATLIDTPGYRTTDDAIEAAAIAASDDAVRRADMVIRVVSAAWLPQVVPPADLLVVNQADLAPPPGWPGSVVTTATTGAGIETVRQAVRQFFGVDDDTARPRWWTDRQRERLRQIAAGAS